MTEVAYPPATTDRTLRAAFTEGDCWLLALHLREQTGWDIAAVLDPAFGEHHWTHVAVRTPSGHVLDVEGVRDAGSFLARWRCSYIDVVDFLDDDTVIAEVVGDTERWTVYAHADGAAAALAADLLAWLPNEFRAAG